jgi:mannose/fructose-specific phosphotransferase system component IIA
MSDGAPARGIVIGHGALAEGLVDAVRQISGIDDALVAISNRGLSPELLAREVDSWLGQGPVVLFTDLPSGSCHFAARRLCHGREDVVVITGVNLPILLDFVLHRDLPLRELVQRAVDRGRAGILCAPTEPGDHAHTPVSGG